MNMMCIVVLGYENEHTISKVDECINNHNGWKDDKNTYDIYHEEFISHLITDTPIEKHEAIDILNAIFENGMYEDRIGSTNLSPLEMDMSDGMGDDYLVQFIGFMPGGNYDGTEYYSGMNEFDIESGWYNEHRPETGKPACGERKSKYAGYTMNDLTRMAHDCGIYVEYSDNPGVYRMRLIIELRKKGILE